MLFFAVDMADILHPLHEKNAERKEVEEETNIDAPEDSINRTEYFVNRWALRKWNIATVLIIFQVYFVYYLDELVRGFAGLEVDLAQVSNHLESDEMDYAVGNRMLERQKIQIGYRRNNGCYHLGEAKRKTYNVTVLDELLRIIVHKLHEQQTPIDLWIELQVKSKRARYLDSE